MLYPGAADHDSHYIVQNRGKIEGHSRENVNDQIPRDGLTSEMYFFKI